MNKDKKLIILLIVLITTSFTLKAQKQEEINILFIGNSFTARHDLSNLVKKVFEEGRPDLTVNVQAMIYGGQSLFQHTEYYFSQSFIEQSTITDSIIELRIQKMEDLLKLEVPPEEYIHFWRDIRGQPMRDFPVSSINIAIQRHKNLLNYNPRIKWDYVVLQSWMDEVQDMNDGYAKYARYLANIAKEQGAEVILYITAPDIQNQNPVSGPLKQENVDQEIALVLELAKEIEPYAVVHVPLAINRIQKGGTDLVFRYVNDFHPNQRTAYLTSNMFYAAFFGESTEGFDFNTVTENKTHSTEEEPDIKLDPDGGPATVVFEGAEKIFLQQMAFRAVSEFRDLWKSESSTGTSGKIFPEDAWGVYSWFGLDRVSQENTPHIKGTPIILNWRNLEPENGRFKFESEIGEKLEKLDKNDFNTFLMVWVAFSTTNVTETDTAWAFTPEWIFKNGVPLVEFPETVNPLGETTKRYFPWYLDEDYQFFFHRMIDSLGSYICNLPPHLKKRILFLQSAEGSTGDGQPYKGSPLNPDYDITTEQWSQFRIETWRKYKSAFTQNGELQLPLLTNYDANEEEQYRWMLDSLPRALGLKNGMFSHGYHISDAQQRLADFIKFRNAVEATGKPFFARGEQDAEWKTYGWSTQNPKQAFYWSAIYATHCGLTMWNVPWEACLGETYADAIKFFNRYAAETSPNLAKGAFCALRRGLDASDTEAFPESIYGDAVKSNIRRYVDIANAFSEYGAKQGDPEKAIGGGMINRKRMDYNDAGWKILKGNYQRHLTQIDPEETSIAWWQVDTTIYGRFARGFDAAAGKDSMFFDLDDRFFGEQFPGNGQEILLEVTYLDSDPGSWKMIYDAADGSLRTAMQVTNTGTGGWITKSIRLTDAYPANRGERGADFILVNTGGTNCRFHMVALDKTGQIEFPIVETTRATYQNNAWQFSGDTLYAWQYDHIQNTSGEMLFTLDSSQTIGIYGFDDISGLNIRSYEDAANYKDAVQFKWDDTAIILKNPASTSLIPDNQDIKIDYNPSSESITIKCGSDLEEIHVYNILGEKVKSQMCHSEICDIRISDFHDGFYLVHH